jgi:putative oxidoreductase
MRNIYLNFIKKMEVLKDLPLLFTRLVLAYGFFGPATMKWSGINNVISWFDSMDYPLPAVSAYLAATTEIVGVFLLLFGLGTRIISMPLMFVMFVAISTVHMGNGFEASNNGFEIPLYYLFMLFVLLVNGPGKYSLDYLLSKKK